MDSGFIPPRSSSTSTFNPSRFPTRPLVSHSNQPPDHQPALHGARRGYSDSIVVPVNPPNLQPVFGQPSGITGEPWTGFLGTVDARSFGNNSSYTTPYGLGAQRPELLRNSSSSAAVHPSYCNTASTVAASRKRNASGSETAGAGDFKRSYSGMRPTTPPHATRRPGSTAATAIDLTTPSPQRRPSSNPQPTNPLGLQSRTHSGTIQLPPWQPDSDVLECPVCRNAFNFWNRKHHCRKCGRVVCDSCSRHRITIPRQHIVQPPPGSSNSPFAATFSALGVSPPSLHVDLPSALSQGTWNGNGPTPGYDRASGLAPGGAEIVRVCNPCVPDPNLSPPPQTPVSAPSAAQPYFPFGMPLQNSVNPSQHFGPRAPPIPPRRGSGLQGFGNSSSNAPFMPSNYGQFSGNGLPSAAANVRPDQGVGPTYPSQFLHGRRATLGSAATRGAGGYRPSNYPHQTMGPLQGPSVSSHRPTHSTTSLPTRPPNPVYGSAPTARFPPQAPPRREIPEEDECPVCGRELPPKGANGDTKAREKHVENCITLHSFSSSTPSQTAPAVPPSESMSSQRDGPTSSTSQTVASGASLVPQPPGAHPSTQEPAHTTLGASSSSAPSSSSAAASALSVPQRTNRMIIYRASEKDCIGEDGDAQECVICFEEFEPGAEMGRLECWCKFHRACIRRWWETKGPGSCPTHQLHS